MCRYANSISASMPSAPMAPQNRQNRSVQHHSKLGHHCVLDGTTAEAHRTSDFAVRLWGSSSLLIQAPDSRLGPILQALVVVPPLLPLISLIPIRLTSSRSIPLHAATGSFHASRS